MGGTGYYRIRRDSLKSLNKTELQELRTNSKRFNWPKVFFIFFPSLNVNMFSIYCFSVSIDMNYWIMHIYTEARPFLTSKQAKKSKQAANTANVKRQLQSLRNNLKLCDLVGGDF